MGLNTYRRKRDFRRTPEPAGGRARARGGDRRYVIQKHAASRLHYDLRLEEDGVLKSWAVPKGPSLNPKDKRLAVQVEDHPVEYAGFEGTIPEGQYGAGTVLLWDRGRWQPKDGGAEGLRNGALKFELQGEKLKGGWALVRLRSPGGRDGKPNWLLIKEQDEAAGERDIVAERPESVATGRDIEEIASGRGKVWRSDRPGKGKGKAQEKAKVEAEVEAEGKSRTSKRHAVRKAAAVDPQKIAGARKASMEPLVGRFELTTLTAEPPDGADWLHEIKLDGFRIHGRVDKGTVTLITRNGLDWTRRFPEIAAAVRPVPAETALIDGELVALLPDGRSSFQALQQALNEGREARLVYFAFDLLYLDGYDLTAAALEDRKRALEPLITAAGGDTLRYSEHIEGNGVKFHREACRLGLEGMISKLRKSPYRAGRGRDWIKVKCLQRQEFVIGGYTDPEKSRQGLGALLLGVYDDEGLRYAGRVGTGFNGRMLRELETRLRPMRQDRSPFEGRVPGSLRGLPRVKSPSPARGGGVHWVRPELVAEVAFTEWTGDGRLRHPSFQGLREDKRPREVKREVPQPVPARKGGGRIGGGAEAPRTAGRGRGKAGGDVEIAGVRLTNPDKILYRGQGVTKGDLARYYEAVAGRMLPEIAGRPLMILRCPEGHEKDCFHQKHATETVPPQVKWVSFEESGKTTRTLVVEDLPGLIALVQMGTLEIHVWGSRAPHLEYPDRLVFDLDPDPSVPWRNVTETAQLLRERLAELGLKSWLKTTGGKGLHVVVPIAPKQTWETVKPFTKAIAERLVADFPDRYTSNMSKARRKGRIFIDYLRNGRGATAIAGYSTRARHGATVSLPIAWEELDRIDPQRFTVATVPTLVSGRKTDPWKGFTRTRQSITQAMLRKVGLKPRG